MRYDMSKILTESRRFNGGRSSKLYVKKERRKLNDKSDFTTSAKFKPMARYGYNSKEDSLRLNPLIRFLKSKVGEDWNDIYSEICKEIVPYRSVDKLILNFIYNIVDKNVILDDDSVLKHMKLNREYGTIYRGDRFHMSPRFFIHPNSNKLWSSFDKRLPERPSEFETKRLESFSSGQRHFTMEDEIWYEYDIVPLPFGWKWNQAKYNLHNGVETLPHDIYFGHIGKRKSYNGTGLVEHDLKKVIELYGDANHYCPGTKKQISRKTLGKFGLKNGN